MRKKKTARKKNAPKHTVGKSTGPDACREWRERQEPPVTQEELGRAIGYGDGSSIQLYETKGRSLPIPNLVRLSRHIGVPIEQLAWPYQLETLRQAAELMGSSSAEPAA